MKKRNTLSWFLSALGVLLAVSVSVAQTFNGSTINTALNSTIPSAGTGGCTVAPQTTGGTIFQASVAGVAANAKLLSVQINMTHTWVGDLSFYLEAPNGQQIELASAVGGSGDNFTNTVFCDAAALSIVTGAPPFTGNFRPEGAIGTFTCGTAVTTNVATLGALAGGQNGTWQLRFFDSAGGDLGTMLGWSLTFGDPACSFAGITLPNLTIAGIDPNVCGATNVSLTAPALACSSPITVFVDGVVLATTVLPGQTFIVPALTSGPHVVRYQLSACDFVSQNINVVDGVKPVITCPANITYNLDPGLCDVIHSYQITASDNCPGPTISLHQNLGWPQVVDIAFVCSNAVADKISYYRVFNINQNITAQNIDLGVWRATPGSPFTVKLYNIGTSTLPTLALLNAPGALLSTTVYNPPAIVNANTINIPLTPTPITAGSNIVVEVEASGTATPVSGSSVGFDLAGETAPTYVYGCVTSLPGFFGNITDLNNFSTRGLILRFNLSAPAVTVVQTSGLPSGATYPIGTTTNCFLATDAAGNTNTCCSTVTVKEYPNPIKTLICNDLVYFSVDANCQGTVTADQVLEGGPYGCYNDYIVELDKTAPFGNGPWVPAVVGPGDIGKVYQVRVIDPENLNNKCWGNIKIEDKLPPVLSCPPGFVPCNASTAPGGQTGTIFGAEKTLPTSSQTINNGFNGVTFDLRNDGANPIQITGFKAPVPGGNHTVEVYVTTTATTAVGNQANAAAWTKIATVNVAGNGAFPNYAPLATVPLPAAFQMAAGQRKGFYIAVTDGSTFGYANGDITTTDGTLSIISAGHSAGAYPFVNANSPRAFIGSVIYKAVLPPLAFPNGLILNQNVFAAGNNCYTVTQGTGTPIMETCSNVTLCYTDASVDQDCSTGLTKKISRKWTATDASGNSKTCIQTVNVLRGALTDVAFPPDYDDIDQSAFECAGAYPTPQWITAQGKQGGPLLYNQPDGCSIQWSYVDTRINVCDGTYKIRRVWTIIDWCTGTSSEYVQLIKVLDKVGPVIACPANVTATTDPFTCCGSVDLPNVIIEDACSDIASISAMVIGIDPQTQDTIGMFTVGGGLSSFPGNNLWDRDTMGNFYTTPCLPIGRHTVVYTATDDCGNTTTCTFRLDVRDYTPPVAACDEFTTVAIGIDDPYDCYLPSADGCQFAGVTWVKAKTFDDGSYDNCGNVRFTIRRMSHSDCILGLNPINGHPECDPQIDPFPDFPSEFERAITEYDSIKFYCCEVGTTQTVILRVYQTDVNGQVTTGPDGTPVFNECMIQVEVQDKIRPVCVSPANVTVSCENFDPSLWAYGRPTVYDNCCLDTTRVYQEQCGLQHTVNYSQFDTLCNRGTLTRTFRVFDCHGQSSQCTQRILVNYEQDYYVKFPDDRLVTVCDGTGNFGEPQFLNKDCELLGVSYTDEVFTVVPDACYKIERTWHVINWCQYNSNLPLTDVPNPNPNATVNSPANNPGATISLSSNPNVVAAPWTATRLAITPGATPTDYSVFYLGGTYTLGTQVITVPSIANSNGFSYKQIIKVVDTQDPVIANCPASPVQFCDLTPNDANFWHQSYYWDNKTESHDLCEGPVDLNITATDACSGENVTIKYLLFLDLDGNGSMETVISSTNLPGFNNVQYNNALNPNFGGGTPYAFDNRPVSSNQKYGFALQTTVSGKNKTGAVRWNTFQSQSNYVIPELPYGTHKIKWIVEDGCGNEAICEYTFVVKDCKAPTVVCKNGLSANIMPTGMLVMWASDFLQYTEDNCTPPSKIIIGIRRVGKPDGQGNITGFPRNADGTPQTSVTFTCTDGLGSQEVELWAIDLAGNADFCQTYIIVQDNIGACGASATVAGVLATEGTAGLEDADVQIVGQPTPGIPSFTKNDVTDDKGAYDFTKAIPFTSNSVLTPSNDNNPLNGVSTYDLVLISKHILGLESLGTPYKMIAADANKSGSITTFDIVELRKLILGIYTELPANTSWRFVDKSFVFTDNSNPFKDKFPESKTLQNIQMNMLEENFVAVKIGDVNGSAVANTLMSSEDRTAGTLMFDVSDRQVQSGEEFEVSFKAAAASQGYQMTMTLNGLSVSDVVETERVKASNFGILGDVLTVSVDGSEEFTVRFRAAKSGQLSQMLGVSSRITKAEAYSVSGERQEVALRFNSGVIAGVGFELYQNQPNPFVSKTVIGFHLPEATTATLTVFDESGRMLFVQKGDFAKGYNNIALDRAVVGSTGVLYYKLETSTDSATKKMIQTK